ncbi:MAG TPA: hypothetical protein VKF83_08685 [Stellaceae bacterium]|nr:hypothetical protein [Stellaceae bacterium]
MRRLVCAAVAIITMFVGGCAGRDPPQGTDCARWFVMLDEAVERAGVHDAAAYRIPGFPYLRADRFLASFRDQVRDDPAAFSEWVDRLGALDTTARAYELRNLPTDQLRSLGVADRNVAIAKSSACAAELRRADLAMPSRREALAERTAVPDDYSDRNRVLGLYPLATLPLSIGINHWQEATLEMFRRTAAHETAAGAVVRYEPAGHPLGARSATAVLAQTGTGRLGIPLLSGEDSVRLFRTFAPIFEIATSDDDDRFGRLVWGGAPAPGVETARPTVYRRLAFTRYRGRILVQLVYTIWFLERPREGFLDLVSGRLDGLVFRVTLDPLAQPLVYDTIHPCGCYHMFFPTARVMVRPSPQPGIEWAFVPAALPSVDPAIRLVLQIASRSHSLVGLRFDTGGRGAPYHFAEDDELRALPTLDGATRSAFGPDGIVPATERVERFVFWPTGVDDTGAMRQWGRHATAFLGRRHFDDPDLIEKRFSPSQP